MRSFEIIIDSTALKSAADFLAVYLLGVFLQPRLFKKKFSQEIFSDKWNNNRQAGISSQQATSKPLTENNHATTHKHSRIVCSACFNSVLLVRLSTNGRTAC
jgi:hypothetical protein